MNEEEQIKKEIITDLTKDGRFTETGVTHLQTAIRVIKIEKFQRFCLNCGKILPLKIKQNYYHQCEKPDFVKDKLGI